MSQDGWPGASSPFHEGEQLVQERVGVRERAERQGRRFIRDHMPEQHREFYAQLPCLLVGSVDAAGRPWASLLAGSPGFVRAPDPRTLVIGRLPEAGDPLAHNLALGVPLGILGIEFATRRRNRMNGRVVDLGANDFAVAVDQSFGNCPKYIQRREPRLASASPRMALGGPAQELGALDEPARRLITAADTFFIATQASPGGDAHIAGVDVSHRGGPAGFVRVDDAATLTWPDFVGNAFFNTIGNLLLNPRAGLLFVDFETGDRLWLTGRVEILWDAPEQKSFEGAERLLRFSLEAALRLAEALPLRWETCAGE
jgi:predicted pyridoxine 5'-phosphate oxidase superfamily flavin-nucleotide-binding protein